MPDSFAVDLAALFRDPTGVTEFRDALASDDDTTLSSPVFLQRAAARPEDAILDASAAGLPGNLIAQARWIGLTAMAEPWLGAVRTWHETLAPIRPASITAQAEHELYWRLAGGWPFDAEDIAAHLAAAPIATAERTVLARFGEAACSDESFRYTFDGAAARVAEIGERIALGQLVLRMTVPGLPLKVTEDLTGGAVVAGQTEFRVAEPSVARSELVHRLTGLREGSPSPFAAPLTPIATLPSIDDRVCCFMRGSDLLVAVAVGDRATGACGWTLPDRANGTWRDVLTGRQFELPDRATLAGLLGPDGRAVLVRT